MVSLQAGQAGAYTPPRAHIAHRGTSVLLGGRKEAQPPSLALSNSSPCSSAQDADATDGLDLLLRVLGEVACFHDHGLLGKLALAGDLHVSCLQHVDHGRLVRLAFQKVRACSETSDQRRSTLIVGTTFPCL